MDEINPATAATRVAVECLTLWMESDRLGAAAIAQLRAAGELADQGRPGKTSEARTFSELGVDKRRAGEWAKLAVIPE